MLLISRSVAAEGAGCGRKEGGREVTSELTLACSSLTDYVYQEQTLFIAFNLSFACFPQKGKLLLGCILMSSYYVSH